MKYLLKSILILIGLIWALPLRAAETTACIKAPSCEELGYTRTIAKCKGVNYLHCPFDSAKVYCILPMKTGDILYSDFTYDSDVIAGKTPIGVIVDPSRRLAAALEYSSEKLAMGTGSTDIFGYSSESSALANFTGASNTEELLSAFRDHRRMRRRQITAIFIPRREPAPENGFCLLWDSWICLPQISEP